MAITFPNTPSPGDQYVAENGYTYEYDGEKWSTLPDSEGQIPAGGTTGQFLAKVNNTDYNMEWTDAAPPTFIGNAPPTGDLEDGQLWWRSDTGVLYIYYTDANSSQWVQAAVGMDTRVQAEVYTGDVPPLGPGEGDLWWNTTDTNLYVYYQSVWVQSNPVPPEQPNYWQRDAATGTVSPSTDGDVLNGIASINGGHAGPNNLVINGAMRVAQRGTSITQSSTTKYNLDRWHGRIGSSFPAAGTFTQETDGPAGFVNSLKFTPTATHTPTAGENFVIAHIIEAKSCQSLVWGTPSAKTITLSFWVKSNKTGTYCHQIYCSDPQRSYLSEYTIDSSDTWEYKTFTVPGDVLGSGIVDDNGMGINLYWHLAAGPDDITTSVDEWFDVSLFQVTSNQVNFFDSTSNEFYLTGVQLTATDTPVAYQHEDYATTLRKCERYYMAPRRVLGHQYRDSSGYRIVQIGINMREEPTATITSELGGPWSTSSSASAYNYVATTSSAGAGTSYATFALDAEL